MPIYGLVLIAILVLLFVVFAILEERSARRKAEAERNDMRDQRDVALRRAQTMESRLESMQRIKEEKTARNIVRAAQVARDNG